MWPGFLAKLRESFSLGPLPGGDTEIPAFALKVCPLELF